MSHSIAAIVRLPASLLAAMLVVGCASPAPSAPPAPPSPAFTRGVVGPLSFTHPSGWIITPVGHLRHYETVLAFLTSATASASESCGPDYVPGMGSGCTDSFSLPAGGVAIRLSRLAMPPIDHQGAAGLIAYAIAGGAQSQTVAGQPAAYQARFSDDETPSSGSTEAWFIAGPDPASSVQYVVVATINGDDPAVHAQVRAIVTSLKIAPSTP